MNPDSTMRYILIAFLLFLINCSDTTAPEDLLEEDCYINVFSELVVINQVNDEQLGSVSRDSLREQVYEKYEVSPEQFNRSHQFYQQQPDKQLERINKIEGIFEEERERFQERLNEERQRAADTTSTPDTLSSGR